ncbi:unnamed protein product [Leptidea sinapis]|uniref:HTH psq-type domain-containing protein n=1 Tax=Leptidea sinapis TaxID=189913 RepID=A0A5E4QI18_9NEOP|nr:unnamed protein product [Leptidea sinapis]
MSCKRKSLYIDEKVLLIRAIETGEKISDVGKRFGFSRSTVFTIWKNKEKILQAEGEGKSSKKLKKPKFKDLDQAILCTNSTSDEVETEPEFDSDDDFH